MSETVDLGYVALLTARDALNRAIELMPEESDRLADARLIVLRLMDERTKDVAP